MKKCIILLLVVVCITLSAQELSNPKFKELRNPKFKGNIKAELGEFADFVAKTTNTVIIYDTSFKRRDLYFGNLQWKTTEDLFDIFLSLVEYNGYIAEIVDGKNIKVIKIKRNIMGPWTQTPIILNEKELEKVKSKDMLVTMVIQLKYIPAIEVQLNLRALRMINPQSGNITSIKSSNTILITDVATNVKRVYEVIKQIDRIAWVPDISLQKHNTALRIENQLIPITIDEQHSLMAQISARKNANVIITDQKGNIIVSIDDFKTEIMLESYIKKYNTLKFEIQTFEKAYTELDIKLFYKGKKYSLWDFAIKRILPSNKIIKFEHSYHGHADYLLASAGSGLASLNIPQSLGVPSDFIKHTLVLPYGDTAQLDKIFKKYGKEIAAVLVEPVGGNYGVVPADFDFLRYLRGITKKYGS
ncbi:MAG: aminotransferase class III-fold pyridoxal phosphate-dependent enzyme, partial [Actinobacteria bacterium]|nr:aminotransferase class III-fold pyridoxal phosphate-dependent enzyme [Actinomycetota bacterium]